MHNYFTHTPVCVPGDERKQKKVFSPAQRRLLDEKVFPGNNLGYRLHLLISANQARERFSAGWTRVSGNKNVLHILSLSSFTMGFKSEIKMSLRCQYFHCVSKTSFSWYLTFSIWDHFTLFSSAPHLFQAAQ